MKAVLAAFNQEKALVGAFSVITNLRMELFEALVPRPELEQESHTEQVRDTAEQNMTTPHFYNIFHTDRGGGARAHGNVQNSSKTVKNITNILRCFLNNFYLQGSIFEQLCD